MAKATLDRLSKTYATLVVDDGRIIDVYGGNWKELVEEAEYIAETYGIEIVSVSSELPEY